MCNLTIPTFFPEESVGLQSSIIYKVKAPKRIKDDYTVLFFCGCDVDYMRSVSLKGTWWFHEKGKENGKKGSLTSVRKCSEANCF